MKTMLLLVCLGEVWNNKIFRTTNEDRNISAQMLNIDKTKIFINNPDLLDIHNSGHLHSDEFKLSGFAQEGGFQATSGEY